MNRNKLIIRRITLCLSLFVTLNSSAQIVGINFADAKPYDAENPQYEVLVTTSDKDLRIYFFLYRNTPIGLKHALSKVNTILIENNCSATPSFSDSFYASYIIDYEDFEVLNGSIQKEESEINVHWKLRNNYKLIMYLTKGCYMVTFEKDSGF
jgi:hypothetical protein